MLENKYEKHHQGQHCFCTQFLCPPQRREQVAACLEGNFIHAANCTNPYLYPPIGQTDNQEWVPDIHGIHSLWKRLCVHWVGLAEIPVPDGFVPAARHQHVAHLLHMKEMPDGCIMLCHYLVLVCLQIPHLRDIIAATCNTRSRLKWMLHSNTQLIAQVPRCSLPRYERDKVS